MIQRILLLCMLVLFVFANTANAQDIARVKQLTTEAETQLANGQWDEAIATLNTIRGIMGSLEGKPKELYNQAQEGKKRQEASILEKENRTVFDKLIREGDDLYDLGYYQKALDKYLEAKKLFETSELDGKIQKVSKLVNEDLAEYYEQKGREYEAAGEVSVALQYYVSAQDAQYSESRKKKIKELKDNIAKYRNYMETGNQAYLNSDYHQALGLFLKAASIYNTEETRAMVPQSTFMTQLHVFDSVLAKNNIRQASRILDTLDFLNTKYKSNFRNADDLQCFLSAAQEFLGNAKALKYMDALAQNDEIKDLKILINELDSVNGDSEYATNCDESSAISIWSKFQKVNALSKTRIYELDLNGFLWNYYVKSYFGKKKKDISLGHLKSLHFILEYGAIMNSYQRSVADFWYYDIEETDTDYPGKYEIEVIKNSTVDYHWDSALYVFNIGVKQLIDDGLYDSAKYELNTLFGYVYFFEGDTSIARLTNDYIYSWALSEKFPKYTYVKYMFKHPSFKESYQMYQKLKTLMRNQQSKWAFSLTIPAALGRVTLADRAMYDYNYTTNQAPYSFRESSAADRNIKYKGPTKLFQTQLSYRSHIGKGRKALQIEWQADFLYLLGKDGTSKWKTYTPKSVGTVVPFYGQIQSAQSLTANRNGYQMIVTGLNPSIRVYKWVHLVLGLNYINLNYNNNFSVPKNESPSNFTLKQTKPVLGFSLDFPGLYKQKWGVHVNYMNYSSLFNSSANLIYELPAEAQRSARLVTLKPMAFQLKTGIQGDFSDWSLKLDYQVFRSHLNYANINPQLYMYRFRGMSWNLLSVSLLKRL